MAVHNKHTDRRNRGMLERANVKSALDAFRENVIADAKRNFTSLGKSTSGKGIQSLDGELDVFENSFSLSFSMEDYMEYQDRGVSGTKKKYITPYSYKSKRPPASAFDKWAIRKGIAPRDEQGRFLSRRSLNFAISTSIFKYGIKPSLFFTSAFEKHFKTLPQEILDAFALDVEDFMEFTLGAK